MAFYMGYRFCGGCSKRVDGDVDSCPYCGYTMQLNDDWKCDDDAPALTDEKEIAEAQRPPDFICSSCGRSFSARVDHCPGCNNPVDKSDKQRKVVDEYFDGTRVVHEGSVRTATEPRKVGLEEHSAQGEVRSTSLSEDAGFAESEGVGFADSVALLSRGRGKLTAIVGFVCLIGLAFWYFFLSTETVQATVTGYSWTRRVVVETYELRTKEDWEVPPSGAVLNSSEKLYRIDQVLDHYVPKTCYNEERVRTGSHKVVVGRRNLGNGRFQDIEETRYDYETVKKPYSCDTPVYRDQPIYRPWYRYKISSWEVSSTKTANGHDQKPVWPEVETSETVRLGKRSEVYNVIFTAIKDGKTMSMTHKAASETEWRQFVNGKSYELEVTKMGVISNVR